MKPDRTDPEILIKADRVDAMIDRMFSMEFLADQMFAFDDQTHPEFTMATIRDAMRYGFLGYVI